jgi:hypothetical protein
MWTHHWVTFGIRMAPFAQHRIQYRRDSRERERLCCCTLSVQQNEPMPLGRGPKVSDREVLADCTQSFLGTDLFQMKLL